MPTAPTEEPPVIDEATIPSHLKGIVNTIKQATGKSIADILKPQEDKKEDAPVMNYEPVGIALPTVRDNDGKIIPPTTPDPAVDAAKVKADAGVRAAADKLAEEEKAKLAAGGTPAPRTIINVVKREPAAPVIEPKKEPTAEEKVKLEADAALVEWEKTLTPTEQKELTIARHAEAKLGKKGVVQEHVDFYKGLEKFIEEHPDLNEKSEEYITFRDEHKPKWSASEREDAKDSLIEERATARAREEVAKDVEPQRRRLKEMDTQPVIARAVKDVEDVLTTADKDTKVLPIDKAVLEAIKTDGNAKAIEKFEIEAPIVIGTLMTAETWIRIRSGLENLDENNETHNFILNLIHTEGEAMLAKPKEQRSNNGREFLPVFQFNKLQRENPEAAKKFYTFTDKDVVGLIAKRGVTAYNHEISKLDRAGWQRKVQKTPEEVKTEPTPTNGTPSPKGGSRAAPGIAVETAPIEDANVPAHLRGFRNRVVN